VARGQRAQQRRMIDALASRIKAVTPPTGTVYTAK
jgi:hypothetical protein